MRRAPEALLRTDTATHSIDEPVAELAGEIGTLGDLLEDPLSTQQYECAARPAVPVASASGYECSLSKQGRRRAALARTLIASLEPRSGPSLSPFADAVGHFAGNMTPGGHRRAAMGAAATTEDGEPGE